GIGDGSVPGVQACALPIVALRQVGATDTTAGRALCACIRAAVAGSGAAAQGAGIDRHGRARKRRAERRLARLTGQWLLRRWLERSEEHTSELQSLTNLVCR